jgi:hypothetical protein
MILDRAAKIALKRKIEAQDRAQAIEKIKQPLATPTYDLDSLRRRKNTIGHIRPDSVSPAHTLRSSSSICSLPREEEWASRYEVLHPSAFRPIKPATSEGVPSPSSVSGAYTPAFPSVQPDAELKATTITSSPVLAEVAETGSARSRPSSTVSLASLEVSKITTQPTQTDTSGVPPLTLYSSRLSERETPGKLQGRVSRVSCYRPQSGYSDEGMTTVIGISPPPTNIDDTTGTLEAEGYDSSAHGDVSQTLKQTQKQTRKEGEWFLPIEEGGKFFSDVHPQFDRRVRHPLSPSSWLYPIKFEQLEKQYGIRQLHFCPEEGELWVVPHYPDGTGAHKSQLELVHDMRPHYYSASEVKGIKETTRVLLQRTFAPDVSPIATYQVHQGETPHKSSKTTSQQSPSTTG